MTDTAPDAKLWDMIHDIRVAMLTTETPSGLESRPMSAYVDKDAGVVWFLTSIDSSKTDEIKDDAKVNLGFANSSTNKFVSVTGTARVVCDVAKQKELWNPFAEAWLPEGPEGPNVALIRVDPAHGTIWDSPGKLAMLVKVAKANITQTPPKDDRVTHVTL